MTGAMYAAISGLKSHMSKLNVIGNNVANVNTYGYKAGTTTFAESIYTTSKAGANGTTTVGGVNPVQIGYGCSIGTISLDMSTKNYVPTGQALHSMVAGDGFFMVGDKLGITDPAALRLTRVGDFKFDESGYLTDGAGNIVYGFLTAVTEDGGTTPYPGADPNLKTEGVSTELVPIRLPAASQEEGKKDEALYPWVDNGVTKDAVENTATNENGELTRIQLSSISIDKTGAIVGTNKATNTPVVVGYVPLATVANPQGVTHIEGPYYQALGGAGETRISSIGDVVKGYLGNKTSEAAGPLDHILGSGDTKLIPGGLESSGTDVATEFSEMITTQRGYQANTRIITVTDAMLEELVNIKR